MNTLPAQTAEERQEMNADRREVYKRTRNVTSGAVVTRHTTTSHSAIDEMDDIPLTSDDWQELAIANSELDAVLTPIQLAFKNAGLEIPSEAVGVHCT